jgi:hypothetical protein
MILGIRRVMEMVNLLKHTLSANAVQAQIECIFPDVEARWRFAAAAKRLIEIVKRLDVRAALGEAPAGSRSLRKREGRYRRSPLQERH